MSSEKIGLREALSSYYRGVMHDVGRVLGAILGEKQYESLDQNSFRELFFEVNTRLSSENSSGSFVPFLYYILFESDLVKDNQEALDYIFCCLEEFSIRLVDQFFIQGIISPHFISSTEEQLEMIERANEMIGNLAQEELPTPVLVHYLLTRGNVFWELSAFSSAVTAFQTAIDTMLATNTIVEGASDACFKVGQYYNLTGDLPNASRHFELGMSFAKAELLDEKRATLRELAFQCYLGAAHTMAHAARAHMWAHEYKQGVDFVVNATYYLSKAVGLDVSKARVPEVTDLLILIIEISRNLRSEKLQESKLIDLLSDFLTQQNPERLEDVVNQLISITRRMNKPEPHYLLLVHDSGAPIFSYAFQQSEITNQMSQSVQDPSDKDLLYSSLLSAISTAMSSASGNKEEIKVIDQGKVAILVEPGVNVTAYLFADRNTQELREALAGFVSTFEHMNAAQLKSFKGDLSKMDCRSPLIKYFKPYVFQDILA